jgi:hypothetical protein
MGQEDSEYPNNNHCLQDIRERNKMTKQELINTLNRRTHDYAAECDYATSASLHEYDVRIEVYEEVLSWIKELEDSEGDPNV